MIATLVVFVAFTIVASLLAIFLIWGESPTSYHGTLGGQVNQVPEGEDVKTHWVVSDQRRTEVKPMRSPSAVS